MRVTPVAPVVFVPKKTDKVENDPQPRKIKKRKKDEVDGNRNQSSARWQF